MFVSFATDYGSPCTARIECWNIYCVFSNIILIRNFANHFVAFRSCSKCFRIFISLKIEMKSSFGHVNWARRRADNRRLDITLHRSKLTRNHEFVECLSNKNNLRTVFFSSFLSLSWSRLRIATDANERQQKFVEFVRRNCEISKKQWFLNAKNWNLHLSPWIISWFDFNWAWSFNFDRLIFHSTGIEATRVLSFRFIERFFYLFSYRQES